MDRYNELKLLLKTWEGEFLKEHKRKPTKGDIENASEETQSLYREFRAVKQKKQAKECVLSVPDNVAGQEEVTDCWGRHLNRAAGVTPNMSSSQRASLKASAHYYGMKLKSNVGTAGKNRPLSLKKTINPPSPVNAEKKMVLSSTRDPPEPPPTCDPPDPPTSFIPDNTLDSAEDLLNLKLRLRDHKVHLTSSSRDGVGMKLNQLQCKVGQRLSSLDQDWLQRCELGEARAGRVGNSTNVDEKRGIKAVMGLMDFQEGRHDMKSQGDTMGSVQEASHMTTNGAEKTSPPQWPKPDLKKETKEQPKILLAPETQNQGPHMEAALSSSYKLSVQEPSKELEGPNKDRMSDDQTTQDGHIQHDVKASRRKRQRDPTNDPDSDVHSQKRHKAKPASQGKSHKRGLKKASQQDNLEDAPKTDVFNSLAENILGEVMEEAGTSRLSIQTPQSARIPQRKAENFVRINLKKKSHVKSFVLNGNRLRKQMWKQKWQKKGEQFGGGGKHFNRSGDTCFHCNRTGHWASQCPGRGVPATKPEEPANEEEEEEELPSLEDVARMTNTHMGMTMTGCEDPHNMTPEVVRPIYEPSLPPPAMTPLYELGPSGTPRAPPPEVYTVLAELGYHSFRPGQERAVMRILSGLSSLVILSTGMGKSLCYQLPAYMYAMRSPCITLVISPLVSLMDDQVSGLPSKLKAVCIHSNMTKNQREAAMEKVKQGKVHVLLLSPEALVGGGFSGSSCLPPADQLPPVAFACIDEVHCVSEWSHNFRPCYLRLCKVLRERLGVRCLLGLTATATLTTAQDVGRHLGVSDLGDTPLRLAAVPPNLHLSVSMDQDRDQALVTLLKGERFGCLDCVIIYCTRREETQRLAALLRTCLQGVTVNRTAEDNNATAQCDKKKMEARKKIRRPLKWVADSYHAGLSAAERRRVQNNFMSGQLRIVVATVAFGMGLDKSDVRGIIHYNMPKSFESYVQEIGRAGRDSKDAQCHLFLDPNSQDLDELRRHIYADSMDYITVKKLVQRVFPKCKCRDLHSKQQALGKGEEVNDEEMLDLLAQCDGEEDLLEDTTAAGVMVERACHRHERALPIEETVQALDVREEAIETLLCYLELHSCQWLQLLHPTLSVCRVTCYSGPRQLRSLAQRCPPVAVALARERLSGIDHTHVSSVHFDVVDVADSMGWEIVPVKRALRDLQWNRSSSGGSVGRGRSGVLAEFSSLSFHFRSYGDLTDEEFEEVCDFLHQKVSSREATALRQLTACYRVFHSVAYRSSAACAERVNLERSAHLKAHILHHFEGRNPVTDQDHAEEELREKKADDWLAQLSSDIRLFLSIHQDERFSGRAIARIFHGIGSPCYPAQIYGRDRRFWRKYLHLDFHKMMQICKEEVIRMR